MFAPSPRPRTLAAALRDLGSAKPEVRASAARDLAIAGLDDPASAVEALAGVVDDRDARVRADVALAFGTLRHESAIVHAQRMLADDETVVRQHAALALGQIASDSAVEVLERARRNERPDVRYQALLAITAADPRRGLDAATDLLDDDDLWVASEAALALGTIHAEASDPDWPTPSDAARAREALRRSSTHRSVRVQLCSAISLARLGDARARATLLDFLAARLEIERSDDHRELRLDALERLADVGFSPEATTVLASLAWRLLPSAERDVARAVLAGFGDARALRALLDQLASRWAAQRQAGVSLARVGKVREATARLVALLDDGAVDPYSVVDALGSIGGREADAALEAVAREEHREDELRERARTLIRRRANPLG